MKTSRPNLISQNKNILLIALGVGLLLLVPLVAMQFTDEVDWGLLDFLAAGVLLFGTGLAFELITRRARSLLFRLAVAASLGTALLLVWSNLAVGIIGAETNPANLMYFGVLAVFILGMLIARFRPQAMARAVIATALAQLAVTLIALFTEPDLDVFELLAANGFFLVLWVGSAWLLQRAGAAGPKAA